MSKRPTRYLITRNCCLSGQCFRCVKVTPYGVPDRIKHMTTDSKATANAAMEGWKAYQPVMTVVEDDAP